MEARNWGMMITSGTWKLRCQKMLNEWNSYKLFCMPFTWRVCTWNKSVLMAYVAGRVEPRWPSSQARRPVPPSWAPRIRTRRIRLPYGRASPFLPRSCMEMDGWQIIWFWCPEKWQLLYWRELCTQAVSGESPSGLFPSWRENVPNDAWCPGCSSKLRCPCCRRCPSQE